MQKIPTHAKSRHRSPDFLEKGRNARFSQKPHGTRRRQQNYERFKDTEEALNDLTYEWNESEPG